MEKNNKINDNNNNNNSSNSLVFGLWLQAKTWLTEYFQASNFQA